MCCRSLEAPQLKHASARRLADVWMLTCTILCIFTEEWHFEDMTPVQIGDALQARQIPAIPDSLPFDLQRMLRQSFTRPFERSSAALMATKLQVIHHALPRFWQFFLVLFACVKQPVNRPHCSCRVPRRQCVLVD